MAQMGNHQTATEERNLQMQQTKATNHLIIGLAQPPLHLKPDLVQEEEVVEVQEEEEVEEEHDRDLQEVMSL